MNSPVHQVTQKQLAAKLGLSRATVSLALADDRRVSAATRERVKTAAEECGYHPDPLLSALSARAGASGHPLHTQASAVLLAPRNDMKPSFYYLDRLYAALLSSQERYGFQVVPEASDGVSASALGKNLYHRGVDAIILGGSPTQAFLDGFPWHLFHVVTVTSSLAALPFRHINIDHLQYCQSAWERLKRSEFNKIAVFLNHELDWLLDQRLSHHWEGIRKKNENRFVEGGLFLCTPANAERVIVQSIQSREPDIVVLHNRPLIAAAVGSGLHFPSLCAALAINVPPDFPEWSGFHTQFGELASAILRELGLMIRYGEKGKRSSDRSVLIHGEWKQSQTWPEVPENADSPTPATKS